MPIHDAIPAPAPDLCLTFANTRYWRGQAAPTEELTSVEDLLRWIRSVEKLPAGLLQVPPAAAIFDAAIALRETIFRCFAATSSGRAPAEADLAAFNAALADAPARRRVLRGGWDIGATRPSTGVLLAPVLWSAADLLVGSLLARVHQCANSECGWLFLDTSKSGNRRWCSMSACGNRAKAHRHYLRSKGK